jgi:hypothetical protein
LFFTGSPHATRHVSISDWRASLDQQVGDAHFGAPSSPLLSPLASNSQSHMSDPFPRPRSNSTTSLRASFISRVQPITEHHLDGERVRSTNSSELFPPPLRTPPPSPGRPSPTNLLLSDLSFSPSRDSPLATRRSSRDLSRAATPLINTPKRNLTGNDLWKKGTELLGKGGFGKVYLGLLQTGELIAVKEMELLALPDTDYQVDTRDSWFTHPLAH